MGPEGFSPRALERLESGKNQTGESAEMSKRKLGQPEEGKYRRLTRKEVRQLRAVAAGASASQTWIVGCRNGKPDLTTGDWHNSKDRNEMMECLNNFWRGPTPMKILATRLCDDLSEFVQTRAPRFGGVSSYIRTLIRTDRSRLETDERIDGENREDADGPENNTNG